MIKIEDIINKIVEEANKKNARILRWDILPNLKYRVFTKNMQTKYPGDTHFEPEIVHFYLGAFELVNFLYATYNLRTTMPHPFEQNEESEAPSLSVTKFQMMQSKKSIKPRKIPKPKVEMIHSKINTDVSHILANLKYRKHPIIW